MNVLKDINEKVTNPFFNSFTVDDFYEFFYSLVGGSFVYIALFYNENIISVDRIASLFNISSPTYIEVIFKLFIFVAGLTTLSIISNVIFNWFFNSLIFITSKIRRSVGIISKKNRLQTILFETLNLFINFLAPNDLLYENSDRGKSFTNNIEYLYKSTMNSNLEKNNFDPLNIRDIFQVIKEYVISNSRFSGYTKTKSLTELGRSITISLVIISFRFYDLGNKVYFFYSMLLAIILFISVKNTIVALENLILYRFYSKIFFSKENK